MKIKNYLKEQQEIIYRTFSNAINKNKLSHAFLIIGDYGTPLKETALYLAKSLLCDNPNPLACEDCLTCFRVENGQYADVILIDGEANNIRKKDIDHITETFSRTSIENKNKVIYILHLVENAGNDAINALLKFLEEPGKNVYAFLTTHNESKILPTIISRSQRLVLRQIPREEIIKSAPSDINKEDLELLSYFYNDINTIKNKTTDENYLTIKECFNLFINNLLNLNELLFEIETKIMNKIVAKEDARTLLDMIASLLEDVIRNNNNEKIFLTSYDKIINELSSKLNHVDALLLELMNLRNTIDLNVNLTGIFEHLAIFVNKEISLK